MSPINFCQKRHKTSLNKIDNWHIYLCLFYSVLTSQLCQLEYNTDSADKGIPGKITVISMDYQMWLSVSAWVLQS